MKRFLFLYTALLVVCSCPIAVRAYEAPTRPTDANVHGHVVDRDTREHIAYATIAVVGTTFGTTTDASGHYYLKNLPEGDLTLEVRALGYAGQHAQVRLRADESREVNFEIVQQGISMDDVVVSASRTATLKREAPALVSVLDAALFEKTNAACLAQGLSFQPGVRVEDDCQNCGFAQVRINGLDGHYSQILMNSRPVFSALAGVYGLEQIPANMIDRVEVMRGGGSALFGSSAIGGTVNIITRDPVVNYAEVSHSLASIGISGSLDNNTTLNASVVNDNNRIGLFVYGQNRSRDGYDHNGDGFTEVAQLKTQTMGARAFLRTSDNTKLTVEYHGTHEYRRGGDRLDRPAHDAMIAEEVDHNIHGGEASFDLWSKSRADHLNIFAAAQNTKRKSYYGSEEDPNAYGRTHDLVVTSGAQWTHNFNRLWFMPAELIAGVEYNHNYLHDVTLGYDHDITQRVNIYSGYLQNEWRNDRWGFLIGARIDSHSMIDNPIISPRANIRFNPSDNINFRLSYSTGFRSPQAYDEDFHVAIVGGERVVTVLAKGLRQESSNSVSASVDLYHRFGNVQTNLMVEGFFTDLRDVFALRKLDQTDAAGNTVLERYNGSGATVGGINIEGKAVFSTRWQLQAGLTWQQSRYKRPEQWSENPEVAPVRQMFRTPDLYGYLTLNYDITRHFNASLSGTYTGSMLVQHMEGSGTDVDRAVTTPEFFDANLKVTYEFKIFHNVGLDVSASVMNIFNSYQRDFDKGHLRDSGYIYGPSLPRSLLASFKLHI